MEGQEKRAGGRNQLYDYGPLQPESNQQQSYGTVTTPVQRVTHMRRTLFM